MSKKDTTKLIRLKEKLMHELCKQRGWNVNELTTCQLLFILSQPEIKNLK